MKKLLILVVISFLLIFSCEPEQETVCNVSDPVQELPWLKERINLILASNPDVAKYQYISQAEYKGETVFVFSNCDPLALALSVFPVYNCENVLLGNMGQIPPAELLDMNVIWKTADSECNF